MGWVEMRVCFWNPPPNKKWFYAQKRSCFAKRSWSKCLFWKGLRLTSNTEWNERATRRSKERKFECSNWGRCWCPLCKLSVTLWEKNWKCVKSLEKSDRWVVNYLIVYSTSSPASTMSCASSGSCFSSYKGCLRFLRNWKLCSKSSPPESEGRSAQ